MENTNKKTIYAKCEANVCPICGSMNLSYGASNDSDFGRDYPWACADCGATGLEEYTDAFNRHSNVRSVDGEDVEILPPKAEPETENAAPISAAPAPAKPYAECATGWYVPVTWEMMGVVRIPFEEAATLEEAFKRIKDNPDIELPKGHYVDDSFAPSFEVAQIEEVRELYNNGLKDKEVAVC